MDKNIHQLQAPAYLDKNKITGNKIKARDRKKLINAAYEKKTSKNKETNKLIMDVTSTKNKCIPKIFMMQIHQISTKWQITVPNNIMGLHFH